MSDKEIMEGILLHKNVSQSEARRRALELLEALGLITLTNEAGTDATVLDIDQNPDAALEMISAYRRCGMDVRVDRYPYIESQTMLSVILPPPFDKMGDREITIALADETTRKLAAEKLKAKMTPSDWARLRLTGAKSPAHRQFTGRFFSQLPGDPAELCLEILADDATCATVSAAGMSEKNMHRILMQHYCMAGSDGNALNPDNLFGNTHPRSFGTAAKFIRILLDSGISIENAVARVTTLPAEFFRLPAVGRIAPGNFADVTVFAPETIDSRADFLSPAQPADGIIMTMSAGNIIC